MAFAVIALALIAGFAPASAQLINPDFERWDGNDPVGWSTFNFITRAVEPTDRAHSGRFAARLMVDQVFSATYITQTISGVRAESRVTLTVHYAGLTQGLMGDIIILAEHGGVPDGDVGEITRVTDSYETAEVEWEPVFDTYDTITVWLGLSPVGDAVTGNLIVDNLILTGLSGQGVDNTEAAAIQGWKLLDIAPNPFNALAQVQFVAPHPGWVTVSAYDLTGRRVAVLGEGYFAAGSHRLAWDAAALGLPAGPYIIQLTSPAVRLTKSAYLVR